MITQFKYVTLTNRNILRSTMHQRYGDSSGTFKTSPLEYSRGFMHKWDMDLYDLHKLDVETLGFDNE